MEYYQIGQNVKKSYDYYKRNTEPTEQPTDVPPEEEEQATIFGVGKLAYGTVKKAPDINFMFNKSSGVRLAGQIGNPLKPTLNEIPREAQELAELVKVSAVWEKEGQEAALRRLATNSPGYTIDPQLSNTERIVAIKPNGKVVVAFRGTNPKAKIKSGIGKGFYEPLMWLAIETGTEDILFKQHKLKPLKDDLIKKYGIQNIEKITGYSMGGTKAHRLADMLGVESTLFNPFIGKKFFESPKSKNIKHQIYRTTEDVATLQALFTQKRSMPSNVKVDSIDPVVTVKKEAGRITKGLSALDQYNILYNHNLEHFTQSGDRNNITREINEKVNERLARFELETKNLNPDSPQFKQKQQQMFSELEPDMKVLSQDLELNLTPTTKLFKSLSTANVVRALGGTAGAVEVDMLARQIEQVSGIPIDHHITTAVSGGLGALPQHAIDKYLGFKPNLIKSVRGGIAGAVAQEVTAEGTNELLKSAGLSTEASEIASQTLGGGVGGLVMQGSPQLARQLALRLMARVGAGVALEAGAVGAGASLAGGLATAGIGFLVGAGISAGFTLYEIEQRKKAPISRGEEEYIDNLAQFVAGGGTVEEALDEIDDSITRDRIRRFIGREGSPEYHSFRTKVTREENILQAREVEDRYARLEEEAVRETGMTIEQQHQKIINDAQQEWRQRIQTEGTGVAQSMFEWVRFDPRLQNARNTEEANRIIIEIIEEGAAGERAMIGHGINRYFYETINNDSRDIPQFDSNGRLIIVRPSEVKDRYDSIEAFKPSTTETPWRQTWDELNEIPEVILPQAESVEIKPFVAPQGSLVLNTIQLDSKAQELMNKGDAHGLNKRIREIYKENEDKHSQFAEVMKFGDATMPQITPKGEIVYTKFTDDAPTTKQIIEEKK